MSPSSKSCVNTFVTAFEQPSSNVKRSRCQSVELPSMRCWWTIVPPYCLFHSHTRSTNASRPRSWRRLPSFLSAFSTTFCVAMPAWSVPGSHSVLKPRIRRQRTRTSWIVWLSAWPMCRMPVTFGGGITTEYGVPCPGSSWKYPFFSQMGYHLASAALAS